MRIAFLNWRDSRHPDGGGAEVFVEAVAEELAKRGHDVRIVCARAAGAPSREVIGRVGLIRVGGRLTVYPRATLWVLRHRRELDVVVDGINGLPFWTPLVRRRGIVALVHHVHKRQWRIIYPGWRGRIGWLIESAMAPRVYQRIPHVTVSQATKSDLLQLGIASHQVHVVRNGAHTTRRVLASTPAGPRLCVLARLVPHKQIEHALRVLRDLRADLPEARLDIVGDGWWAAQLHQAARELGVADHAVFHGHVDNEKRDSILAASAAMLLPSIKEGWGLAIVEAAVQETPTIAYRWAGGVAEAIDDGVTGVLVDDLPEMVSAARELLRDDSRRVLMGRAARERALSFSWSDTTDKVEQLLHQQLREPKISGPRN